MGGTNHFRGARSRTSQVSSSGTEVPVWSGWKTRMNAPAPICGATTIPAAMSRRTMPSRPLAWPRPSSPAVSTNRV